MTPRQPSARSINLRFGLPLLIALASVLIFGVLMYFERSSYQDSLGDFVQTTVPNELLWIKRNIDTAYRQHDEASVQQFLAELDSDNRINYAVLLDEQDRIIASSRATWIAQRLPDVQPAYPQEAVHALRHDGNAPILLNTEHHSFAAATPIALPSDSPTETGQGVLLIEYDLSPIAMRAWQHWQDQALIVAIVTTLGALLLFLLMHHFVNRPFAALMRSMDAFEAGDFHALPKIHGHGELARLSQKLSSVAHTLEANMQTLADNEMRFRQLADASFEAVVLHEDGFIINANAATERLLGLPTQMLIGRYIYDFIVPQEREANLLRAKQGVEDRWSISLLDHQGQVIPCEINARQRPIGERIQRVLTIRDLRARLEAEAKIQRLSYTDPVTGLANRHALLERIATELSYLEDHPAHAALVTFNLDGFAAINDSLGMAAGDALLRNLAQRLSPKLNSGTLFARVEADTFAVLFGALKGDIVRASLQVSRYAEALLDSIAEPFSHGEEILHLTAGAGIVMIPNDSTEPRELLREAETAMHQAKEAGTGQLCFFAHNLQSEATERLRLRNDLKQALLLNQFVLYYQPQTNAQGKLLGVEALVRWQHPARGLLPPSSFIPEAEASGLIVPLGNWVLAEAVACLKRIRATAWGKNATLAVNISSQHFREADFVERMEPHFKSLAADAGALEIELTESVVAEDLDATMQTMAKLKSRGLRFALDDFGTGYSSLSYLKYLPIDTLKIDRSFVMDIDATATLAQGKRPAVLLRSIVTMAHQLELSVLAEGVETPAQLEWLTRSGCDKFQGYYFSRPLSEAELFVKY